MILDENGKIVGDISEGYKSANNGMVYTYNGWAGFLLSQSLECSSCKMGFNS